MNSEFQTTLRRLKPEKRRTQLKARAESDLAFIETTSNKAGKLLYDTTVYILSLIHISRFPHLPIVWGGYFATNYTAAVLNADYVDYAVRGQGEQTFLDLLEAIRGRRDFKSINGLSYKDSDGIVRQNPERPMRSPDDFPWYPYHRIPAEKYLLPTFLGRRTAVHQASIGCPFRCNFCGVVNFSGSREKMESPCLLYTSRCV